MNIILRRQPTCKQPCGVPVTLHLSYLVTNAIFSDKTPSLCFRSVAGTLPDSNRTLATPNLDTTKFNFPKIYAEIKRQSAIAEEGVEDIMEYALVIPEYLQNDVYLPASLVSRLIGVGKRSLRSYAQEDLLQKRYYTLGNKFDLVCYAAYDVLKLAHDKKMPWRMETGDIDEVLAKDDTYVRPKKQNPVIDKTTHEPPKAAAPQPPAIVDEVKLSVAMLDRSLDGLAKTLESIAAELPQITEAIKAIPGQSRHKASQPVVTILCIFVWAALMVYVAITIT